jgi:anti-sigma regulatory factor (Ser/Thr protein kinase)
VEAHGLVHDAFVYSSDDEFRTGALPFLEEGIELGEPILAAPTEENARLLRRQLGHHADSVDWAENAEAHGAVERLGIFLDYIERRVAEGASRVRLLGEPCWPPHAGPGVAEWKRYESFLNVALASHPVWLVCPYDGMRLSPDIVDDARLTHPNWGHGEHRTPSADYLEPEAFADRLDSVPLPAPPEAAADAYFARASVVRRFVRERASSAGLPEDTRRDAELATGEVAANVFRHAALVARVRTWTTPETFVCEIGDTGRGIDDPFAGYEIAKPTAEAGRGLMIARRVADVIEIRSTPAGSVVRMHFRRD